ncbi:MAG: NADH-quinone oxidoreductase subunit NuoK [Puniceicoccales bacterium]|jgi:NADH-quinone oxidoreductase subunit K|nr:NADH-quinone oxidoreductase subunit NuoK [Puniceicoccales bacterium]
MTPLHICLIFSALLFATGLAAALARSSGILVLLGVELMLNAANINLIAFWRFPLDAATRPDNGTGIVFVLFSIAVAAAEAAVGLALIIAIYRHRQSIRLQDATALKG